MRCILNRPADPLVLSKNVWLVITIIYIGIASVTHVWVLLQPRDYLNSFLLYAMIFFAFIGIIVYSPTLVVLSVRTIKKAVAR